MAHEIKVPEVGESITEGILVEWLVEDGDVVEMDQPLFELETDKITMTVAAEAAGKVSLDVEEDSKVEVGQTVGTIDEDAAEGAAPSPRKAAEEEPAEDEPAEDEPAEEEPEQEKPRETAEEEEPEPAGDEAKEQPAADEEELDQLSPAVRRLVSQHDLDPDAIEGTGKDGRLLKEDVLKYLASRGEEKKEKKKAGEAPKPEKKKAEAKPASARPQPKREPGERQTRKSMSSIRKRIAERLLEAKHGTAMLTTFNEVDMSNMMAMRERYKEPFREKYGIKLGVMSFFLKASVDALKQFPQVNSFIEGDELVENHYYDIGVAVSTERGLMVPVIRDVDKKTFAEIEFELSDLAKRAREGRIGLDELQGGTFTVTNGGVFGSMLSTPILNPPQSAILGMHGITKRPVVIEKEGEDTIEIRPMMYLAVSYDHRVIDGRESVSFLRRIMDCIENPERMMFEI